MKTNRFMSTLLLLPLAGFVGQASAGATTGLPAHNASLQADANQPATTGSAVTEKALVWLEQQVTSGGCCSTPPPPNEVGDEFGIRVAVQGDLAVIGAPNAEVSGLEHAGKAFVFRRLEGSWQLAATLTASVPGFQWLFGSDVAIVDADTLLIASSEQGTVPDNENNGAVYVFQKLEDGTWNQIQKFTSSDVVRYDQFGSSIDVDGKTAVIGAKYADPGGKAQAGAAYVFAEAADGTWNQMVKLVADDGAATDQFGRSVAISGDTVLIGSYWHEVHGQALQGAAYVFTKENGVWPLTQTQELVADDGHSNDQFGWAVALDDGVALISAPFNMGNTGAVYAFVESNGEWAQSSKLTPETDFSSDLFGTTLFFEDGIALIHGPAPDDRGAKRDAVFIYKRSGGQWQSIEALISTNDDAYNDSFGDSMAWDNGTMLIGDSHVYADAALTGVAYFYSRANLDLTLDAPATAEPGDNYDSTITLANNASISSPVVSIVAPVPENATYVTAEPTQGDCSSADGILTCDLGQLTGNGSAEVKVTLMAADAAPNEIVNSASVAHSTPELTADVTSVIDDAPVASDDDIVVEENGSVLDSLHATDLNDDLLTYSFISKPAHGSVVLNNATTGAYLYQPNADYTGTDSFTFKANDSYADSNTGTINITVRSVNAAPRVGNLSVGTQAGTAVSGTFKATDANNGDTLTFSIVTPPEHGSVKLDDSHEGTFTYTPESGFSGKDSFAYKANDGEADSNVGSVTVTVQAESTSGNGTGTSSSGGGGGGAAAPLQILLLGWLALAAGRKSRKGGVL